jgi:hypothetical protein
VGDYGDCLHVRHWLSKHKTMLLLTATTLHHTTLYGLNIICPSGTTAAATSVPTCGRR